MQEKETTQDEIVQGILHALRAQLVSGVTGQHYDNAFDRYRAETIEFFKSIDWTQPWLITLMLIHVVYFAITILSRNNSNVLTFHLAFLLLSAGLAQPINTFCREHWQSFANANYFDENGFFISMIYALPLLLNATLGMAFILRIAANMIIDLKRRQICRDAAAKSKKRN